MNKGRPKDPIWSFFRSETQILKGKEVKRAICLNCSRDIVPLVERMKLHKRNLCQGPKENQENVDEPPTASKRARDETIREHEDFDIRESHSKRARVEYGRFYCSMSSLNFHKLQF